MYKYGSMENSQRLPTQINQNWGSCQSKVFSGISDTVRNLKALQIISNKMTISMVFLVVCTCI